MKSILGNEMKTWLVDLRLRNFIWKRLSFHFHCEAHFDFNIQVCSLP